MKLVIVLSISLVLVDYTSGHARLIQPPSRSSMWRFGFKNPADYNDNQGFCGGIKVCEINYQKIDQNVSNICDSSLKIHNYKENTEECF